MKTRQTITALLWAAVGIWSCQQEAFLEEEMLEKHVKEDLVNEPAPLKQVSVTALWQSDETRTSVYHDDDAHQYSFLWEQGDAISFVEVDPSITDEIAQTVQSNPLSEQCSTARFSLALNDRDAGDNLHYVAFYPATAMPEGKDVGWDATGGSVQLPLTLPLVQRPGAVSFDGAADLLVSHQVDLNARPEDIELTFERVGTVLKLVVTGIKKETQILGGTLDLGYDCGGEILYDAKEKKWSAVATGKQIEFSYVEYDKKTGAFSETEERKPVKVGEDKSLTVWLRVLSGKANDWIKLSLDTVSKEGEYGSSYRDIDLVHRNASINFKEGGVTTFSVNLQSPDVVLSSLSSVPKLYIGAAFNEIRNKTDWVTTTATFVNGNGTVLYEDGEASIRGRGNTTWTFPKKPYYLKLNKDKKKVNMFSSDAKSRKYILLANWMDRTNLRNAVAFEAARKSEYLWTPKGEFVDLYLNGEHKGLYYLVEKIEVEAGRLSADYLFTMDMSDQSEWHFKVDYGYRPNSQYTYGGTVSQTQIPVEVKYPEAEDGETPEAFKTRITPLAKPLIETFAQQVSVQNSAEVADLNSFCDWLLVHSLCVNLEPNHPKSCYMYYKSGKMYAGPVWDFDWGTFVLGKTSGLLIGNCLFYGGNSYVGFFQDPVFVANLKARWRVLKPEFETLVNYIGTQADWIQNAEAINHTLWPIQDGIDPFTGAPYSTSADDANGDKSLDFQPAVDRMKTSIGQRISAIDTAIEAL